MSLKRKITKAEYEKLHEAIKVEYKAEGEEFVLDAEGFDDASALKRAKDREKELRTDAEAENAKLTSELKTLREANGNIATLEASWKKQLADANETHRKEVTRLTNFLNSSLVDGVAQKIATELAGDNAEILVPHIKARLTANLEGDKPLTRVLDKEGKPSAISVDDLAKEFRENKRYAPLVIVSKASGSGAAGGSGSGDSGAGAGGGAPTGQKKFHELNDQERTALFKNNRPEFDRLVAEQPQRA